MGIFNNWFKSKDKQLKYILRITYMDGAKEDQHITSTVEDVHKSLNNGFLIVDDEILNLAFIRKIILVKK